MNTSQSSISTRLRVGLFSLMGICLIIAITVFVNDKPFWWRPCDLVHINIDDATGLKTKSPIRSLGIQIGYLKSVELTETYVRLGICVTAPVEVLPSTRAYIRGEGFLGDKFVELKPVRYTGERGLPKAGHSWNWIPSLFPSAHAQENTSKPKGKDIPVGEKSQDVQHLVEQVDGLVDQMTSLTSNLKESFNPQEMKSTLQKLNRTLENASRTLSPEGGLNTTAQRTLAKLEDAIEQLRDLMTRVNKGEGSVGMLLNDPEYAEEIRHAIKSINRLLGRATDMRLIVDIGMSQISELDGARAWFRLAIWPSRTRYYRLGITAGDPRGRLSVVNTTTVAGGISTTTQVTTQDQASLLLNFQLGTVLMRRLDLAVGAVHGDGAVSVGLNLGPHDREEMLILASDIYGRGQGQSIDSRINLALRPFVRRSELLQGFYFTGGLDSIRKLNGATVYSYGAGITFDDEDIKLLFAFM